MAWIATEDFDSYPNGALNLANAGTGWSAAWVSDTDFSLQGTTTYSGARAVKFTATSGNKQASRLLTTAVTSGVFSIYMRKEGAESIVNTVLFDGGVVVGSNDVCTVGFASSTQPASHGGEIYLAGTTTIQLKATYSLSTWYHIEIQIDGAGTQCRGRVDDGAWSSYVTMANSKNQVSAVGFTRGSSGAPDADAYWDLIRGDELFFAATPDANTESTTVDGECGGTPNASWASARDITTSTPNDTATTLTVDVGKGGGGNYSVSRVFFLFDLSSLSGVTFTSAVISLFAASKISNSGDDTYDYVSIIATSPASNTSLASGDVDNILGTDNNIPLGATVAMKEMHDSSQRKDIDSISTTGYTEWTLNATGVARLSAGIVKFGAAQGFDVENVTYAGANGTNESVSFHSADNASGLAQAPRLTVTYTQGGVLKTAIFFGVNF